MRILYGVTGEGLGHAMRSRVIAGDLVARGHEVKLVASGRACRYLGRYFDDVQQIPGFTLAYARGGIGRLRTAARIGRSAHSALRDTLALYRRSIAGFQPDACISDFDSFTHMFGKLFDRPVISVDHQHVIDRCQHPHELASALSLTRAVVRAKLPGCAHYVVTSFYRPPLRRRALGATTLVGPILRPEVLALMPSTSDHVLVYQTATRDLVEPLHALADQRFIVYGCGPGGTRGNVTLRDFDETTFLADLASARAVICNGGYTLMSEALYLGKPVLSIPLRRHGEQQLNARYLAALGLGRTARVLDVPTLRAFIATLPTPSRVPAGNAHALSTIHQLLEEIR
jgi:uncharacterized protein (TIGR00661 family)